jgi:hypothetical protein
MAHPLPARVDTSAREGGSYPSLFDELVRVRALERKGLDKVVDRAVHQILDGCRNLRPGPSSLTTDSDAFLELERLDRLFAESVVG